MPRDIARDIAAGFCGGRWRGGGLAPGGGGLAAPSPSPGPPSPPSPCAVAPRRSRSRSVARPSSPLPSHLVTCWLRSLCRSRCVLTVRYVLLRCHTMAGYAPMRMGIVLVRSFSIAHAVPAHPATYKPHAGGKASGACPPGASPTGCRMRADFPEALPPALRGERCAPPAAARTLFVRCRPLLGGVRWAARGGVNMCHAVWCVPVRMGIVLVRSFLIAHAAPTHQTAMRRAMRRTQPVRPRPHILGPQFPQNLPVTGQGLLKNPWALTPRPAPQENNIRPYWQAPLMLARLCRGLPTWPNIGGQGGGWHPRIGGRP